MWQMAKAEAGGFQTQRIHWKKSTEPLSKGFVCTRAQAHTSL